MYNTSNITKVFNNHFMEFIGFISDAFPNDMDVAIAKNKLIAIKKINPKMIIKIWRLNIADKYNDFILKGDLHFFIDKNYSEDLANTGNTDKILNSVDRLRDPIRKMGPESQAHIIKYIQNLSKLSQSIELV